MAHRGEVRDHVPLLLELWAAGDHRVGVHASVDGATIFAKDIPRVELVGVISDIPTSNIL